MGQLTNHRDKIILANLMVVVKKTKHVKEKKVMLMEYQSLMRSYFLSITDIFRASYSSYYLGGNMYLIAKHSKEYLAKRIAKREAEKQSVNKIITKNS